MIDKVKEDNLKMNDLQDYEIYEEEYGYKINRYEITTYVTQRSVESLIKWVDKKKIIIPDFQRDYVWSKAVASKLIDSVLLNLPIPNIFLYKLYKDGEEVFYVVDGFQRIQTLKFFKDGVWSQHSNIKDDIDNEDISQFKINFKSSEWYGKTYSSLSNDDKFNFDEYSVNLTIFEQSNPDNKNSMFEVFERINTGSDKLSEQEIRNAIYSGNFLNDIREKANNQLFKSIVENDISMSKRQNYVDLFLRFVAYYYAYKNDFNIKELKINNSKRETLNNFCDYFNKKNKDYYEKYISDVEKAITKIYEFSPTAFYGKKRNEDFISNKIHAVFAEGLVLAVIANNFEIKISKEDFDLFKLNLWYTEKFESLFVQQTTTKKNILARIDLLLDVINNEY